MDVPAAVIYSIRTMQFRGQGKPPAGIIFDAAIGERISDLLGLAVLYGLDGKGECRVVSSSTSKSNLRSAALSEVIGRFYAGTVSGAFGAGGRTLPVGLSTEGKLPSETPMMKAVLGRTNGEGKPAYNHGIQHLNDTAEVPALIRNAFTSQFDQNAVVVLAGPATNLAAVLAVKGAKEWISQKVKQLVWVAGEASRFSVEKLLTACLSRTRRRRCFSRARREVGFTHLTGRGLQAAHSLGIDRFVKTHREWGKAAQCYSWMEAAWKAARWSKTWVPTPL